MIRVDEEVAAALAHGRPVVALESTIIAHGLPRPDNLRVAREIEAAARAEGAVPATVAVLGGEVRVGLDAGALEEIAAREDVAKLGVRDLGPAIARGVAGATTVASTAYVAARAGIEVFATGGLGGVHRGAAITFDESADLLALAGAPIVVVCAGVKSILDVGATLERLETLSVPVLGFGTDRFAGFYLADSGHPVPWRVDTPRGGGGRPAGPAGAGPPAGRGRGQPAPRGRADGPGAARPGAGRGAGGGRRRRGGRGAVTPFVLARFHERTGGASLRANVRLVLRNAALAGRIARGPSAT